MNIEYTDLRRRTVLKIIRFWKDVKYKSRWQAHYSSGRLGSLEHVLNL